MYKYHKCEKTDQIAWEVVKSEETVNRSNGREIPRFWFLRNVYDGSLLWPLDLKYCPFCGEALE